MEPFAKNLVGGVVIVSFALAVFPAPAEPLPPGMDSPGQRADPCLINPRVVCPAADTPQSAGQPFKLPRSTINSKGRFVDVEASVCLDGGTLELIACTKYSKEHESVIVVAARPIDIHTALLLLGAKNGGPARPLAIGDEEARWVDLSPKGDLIDVFLEFKDSAGMLTESPISAFITRSSELAPSPGATPTEGDKAPRFPSMFIFAGSQIIESGPGPKTYLAERSCHVISIATFGDEMLCLPEVHSQNNGALMWSIDPTHLPKKGIPVTLTPPLEENS
jgi:hypothetical protein